MICSEASSPLFKKGAIKVLPHQTFSLFQNAPPSVETPPYKKSRRQSLPGCGGKDPFQKKKNFPVAKKSRTLFSKKNPQKTPPPNQEEKPLEQVPPPLGKKTSTRVPRLNRLHNSGLLLSPLLLSFRFFSWSRFFKKNFFPGSESHPALS